MLLVKTMKGSGVIAKMAGMESTAKIRSVISTMMRARNRGVMARRPMDSPGAGGRRVKNRCPSKKSATG